MYIGTFQIYVRTAKILQEALITSKVPQSTSKYYRLRFSLEKIYHRWCRLTSNLYLLNSLPTNQVYCS